MTKIDFYILEDAQEEKSLHFVCQYIEKVYQEHKRIYLHTASYATAEKLDKLLWIFRDDSFLPHQLFDKKNTWNAPIEIGYCESPKQGDLLINLTQAIPVFYQQFNHLIEIVFAEPTVQQLARERYRQYRDLGLELTTHKIKTI